MAKMMRAGVVHAFGKPLTIEEIPIPTPRPGEVLIKVVASGVCHTDLHAAEGDWLAKPSLPFVPGHEGVGIIAACGSGVVGLKEGDHAGVAWLHDACGQCEYCMTGWDSLCYAQPTPATE
jgi:propanol-preferring alcohol dehydrogenase